MAICVKLFYAGTFRALTPGIRSLATLKLVVNVVGELNRKEQMRHRAVFLRRHGFLVVTANCVEIYISIALLF